MAADTVVPGVARVELGQAVALFAGSEAAPAGLDNAGLAAAAAGACRRALGRDLPVLYARQEHTAVSYVFAAETGRPLLPGGHDVGVCDALITAEPWVALTVRTADCLPVVLAGGGVVAAIHAGWRGLAGDILGAVVGRIGNEFGVAAADLEAAIGVGIGKCHFAVGPEVPAALARHGVDVSGQDRDGFVDLAAWAAGRLRFLGVEGDRIRAEAGCTFCDRRYHSWRRDRDAAGRQWNAVVLTPGG